MIARRRLVVRSRLPGYLREDDTIRWWHPGAWLALARGWLRDQGVLPRLCLRCGGQGRLVRDRFLRRVGCPACQGTGRLSRQGRFADLFAWRRAW